MPRPPTRATEFDAFVSYSHASDERIARTVQGFLHRFAKPWYQARATRVFRDKTDLAITPTLWPTIECALLGARFFILLASPASARSPWVGRELEAWLSHADRRDRLLIVLSDGEIAWNARDHDFDWTKTSALPDRLRNCFPEEPLHVDLRWLHAAAAHSPNDERLRSCLAPLAATVRGISLQAMVGEHHRQHRRTRFVLTLAVAALLSITAVAGWTSVLAARRGEEARERERDANHNLAGRLQQEASLALLNAATTQVQDHYGDAWLYTLASLDLPLVTDRALPVSVGRLLDADLQRQAFRLLWSSPAPPGRFCGVATDADGTLIAAAVNGTEHAPGVYLFDARTGVLQERTKHATWLSLAQSHDGKHLAIGTPDGLLLRELRSGKEVRLTEAGEWVVEVALSSDGSVLAAVNANSPVVTLWDVAKQTRRGQCSQLQGTVRSVAFDPGTTCLATGDEAGVIRLWRLDTCEEIGRLALHQAAVSGVAFMPTGGQLASCSWDGTLRLWDLEHQVQTRVLLDLPGQPLRDLAFAHDGSRLACGGEQGLRVWAVRHGKPVENWIERSRSVDCVAFSADGRRLLTGGDGLGLLDAVNGEQIAGIDGHSACPTGIAIDPSGRHLVSWDERDQFLWTFVPGTEPGLARQARGVTDARFTSDGDLLLAFASGSVERRAPGTGEVRRRWEVPPAAGLRRMCLSADGGRIAIEAADGGISVYDLADDRLLATLLGHGNWIDALAFEPGNARLASIGRDLRLRVWSLDSGKQEAEWSVASSRPHSLVFRDRGLLAWSSGDGRIRLWNLDEGRGKEDLDGSPWQATTLALSPDRRVLAAGGGSGICLWELPSRRLLGVLRGHGGVTSALCFDASGRRLASGGSDNRVQLWDVGMASPWAPLQGPLMWSAESGLVALCQRDGTTALQRVDTQELVRHTPQAVQPTDQLVASHDGTLGAAISQSGASVWNLKSGELRATATFGFEKIPCAAFDPQGHFFALGTGDLDRSLENQIWVWDLATGQRTVVLEGHGKCVDSIALDASFVASASRDGTIRVSDHSRGGVQFELQAEATCLAILPVHEVLAFGLPSTGAIALAQMRTGRLLDQLPGSGSTVVCLAATSDGSLLAAGTAAGTIDLWDVRSRRHLASLHAGGELRQLSLRGDGRELGCWSSLGCRWWDLRPLSAELSDPERANTIRVALSRSSSHLDRTLSGTAIDPAAPTLRLLGYAGQSRDPVLIPRQPDQSVWEWLTIRAK